MAKAGATEEHSNGIIQYAKDISGVELAAVLREVDDSTIKVSLRSQSIVDVSVLAKKFGGGGHRRASGCTINLPLIQAQENLMKAMNHTLRSSDGIEWNYKRSQTLDDIK